MRHFLIILIFSLAMQLVLTQIKETSNQNVNDEPPSKKPLKEIENDFLKDEKPLVFPGLETSSKNPRYENYNNKYDQYDSKSDKRNKEDKKKKDVKKAKDDKKAKEDKKNKDDNKDLDEKKKVQKTRMENFLHNYMNKLERLLRPLKDKDISDRYKSLAEEYFKRLSTDSIDKPKGFQMGDMTIELLDLSNYVLDTVDITEMKKAGVLKNFLLDHVKKNKPKEKKEKPSTNTRDMNYDSNESDSWYD